MPKPWFETIFDERYPELFAPLEGDAEEEVDQILRLLSLPPGAAALDLGCGRGRHAIPMARRGMRVTGVDLSDHMLRMARERAAREDVVVEWVREDMRTFRRPGAFDACLSLFTSFGFFCDEENQRVLENIARSLKEDGVLLLDLRNAGKGLSPAVDHDTVRELPSGILRMSVRFDRATGRARAEHVLERRDGIRISSAFEVRVYTVDELRAMLAAAGIPVRHVFGSLKGAPFTESSGRLVIIAGTAR